jgi:lipoyl(octanoyl) transferase
MDRAGEKSDRIRSSKLRPGVPFQLLTDGPASGAENMARDEALLQAGVPALRFYSWHPACVSIGFFQNPERDIDLDYLAHAGIDLVRRPTGGRAVLHEHEITYAMVLPERYLPPGTAASYRLMADMIVSALASLGVACEVKPPAGRPDRSAGCFSSTSAYEISVAGRKVVGSAQVRRNGIVLQHGSILLSVDYERQARCLKGPAVISAGALAGKMIGLEAILGRPIAPAEIIEPLVHLFGKAFPGPCRCQRTKQSNIAI